jgi:hypothetical protein
VNEIGPWLASNGARVHLCEQWEEFVSPRNSGLIPTKALPKKALLGDLHTMVTGKVGDGSARIQIYWCSQSGDGTRGNHAAWTPFQLGANPQQCE